MGRARGSIAAALTLAALGASGCGGSGEENTGPTPVRIFPIAGTPLKRLVVTPEAATRIGVQTAPASATAGPGGARMVVVPYAAVLYDANGAPSVYTSPAARVYIRHPIGIDHIAGNTAILKQGPTAGTAVVVVGADELFGAETGVKGG
ncbi:MAG: hypothetical protein QOK25_103 [Thermoleophilaceae bacterium]|nr:hypothetical protein [Thermoleophilaceae bacterium]